MILTLTEVKWLTSHGGRTKADVFIDEKGKKYVYMTDMRNPVKVYINLKKKKIPQDFTSLKAWQAYSMEGRIKN